MSEAKLRDYLKKVTGELQVANRRLDELEERDAEPIAIVGISCRYPGGAESARGLWDLVRTGGDGVCEFPTDRGWEVERLYDPDPERTGGTYVRQGGFVADAAEFDPAFFGVSPREALTMDPQQRLLLEGTWEALEDAGIDPSGLRGSSTGVFAGVMYHDYAGGGYAASTGIEESVVPLGSVVSGRVAYTLGLEGPAVTIDTACSSSLVAMHLAAQALRSGECELALAGGVTVLSTPGAFVDLCRQRGLAPDGRCKSFAAAADGAGLSEGMGLLLLERLSDAKRNDRRILAVIKGSATNQDGASNGLTAPNGPSQERVIRQALANAGLKPSEVDAVEAHGTGTSLGDPIEAQALLATYGQERENGPLALGSLKSNVGHTQAAAGVGGVIKMVMALREEALPKTLHVDEPTPHVNWDSGAVELLTEQREWKRGERPRRAGVSSFGISGTNAHLILEEAPQPSAPASNERDLSPAIPWALSAKSPEALAECAGRLAAHLEQAELDPIDVAHTLLASRATLPHRAVVVGAGRAELLAGLDALAQGKGHPTLAKARAGQGKAAFLFSGQGSQSPRMGTELYEAFPVYADAFDRACEALGSELGAAAKEAVFAAAGTELAETLSRTDVTQAALFALQVALYELFASFGAAPDYLIGHSVGEISAAHVAGVLSLEDAAKLVAARGSLMAALLAGGAMASIRATEAEVVESLAPHAGKLTIAAINAPASIAVSGDEDALVEWIASQEEAGRKVKRLDVSHAFHSHRIEPMLEQFEQVAAGLELAAPRIPVVSNRSGEPLTEEQATSPAYWASHAREAVRFAAGVDYLRGEGATRFVEIGPGTTLTAIAAECLAAEEGMTLAPALRSEVPEAASFATALGALHAAGAEVELAPLAAGGRNVELPTYPFQRQRYWLEATAGGDPTSLGLADAEHPILGASIALAEEGEHLFSGRISATAHPWLEDHAVAGTPILPATGFAELALHAGRKLGADHLVELILEAPLQLPEQGAVQLRLWLKADEQNPDRLALQIHSRPQEAEAEIPWTRHASGVLAVQEQEPELGFDASAWPPAGAEPVAVEDFYDLCAQIGIDYGPAFQGLDAAWRLDDEVYAEVSLAEEQRTEAERYGIHPALLDAALQAGPLAADLERFGLPFSFTGVSFGEGSPIALRVRVSTAGERISIAAADSEGAFACAVEGIRVRPVDPAALASSGGDDLFRLEWAQVDLPDAPEPEGTSVHRVAPVAGGEDMGLAARALTTEALEAIQTFLADTDRAEERLAVLTEKAVAVAGEEAPDPAQAAVWGLVRSAQTEHPGRLLLIDGDGSEESEEALGLAIAQREEPQLALRGGMARAPRLLRAQEGRLVPPAGSWRLAVGDSGSLEGLALVADDEAERPLEQGEVRVAMQAAGLNFRDVLIALGIYPVAAPVGGEGAGVVIEVGPGVEDLAPGDRVMGFAQGSFGPLAIGDRRGLVRLPDEWSFVQGAALPVAACTAYYGLVDLAALQAGERVLIHAGAGGVGMAAIQIARHIGAEVFATASPAKWEALRSLGLDDDHIASSRTLDFKDQFLAATGGEGMDVVLNSLAREFVDASLELLPRGGRFAEMGKTDIRDPEQIAVEHPGVSYRPFDLVEAGAERSGELLTELLALFAAGSMAHAPTICWDVRRAPEAFRFLSQARHVGKLVLTHPRPADPGGTVLVTGGLSGLGAIAARHIAAQGARHMLLSSRRGPDAPGAEELVAELAELGCEATAVACDVSNRAQLQALLAEIPAEHPLTAVVHSAGLLEDGTVEALDSEALEKVLAPKAEAAWHLHELTEGMELSEFVLYSSAAGIVGSPGQANYAAANSFLDALAERRRSQGQPATAIAWGLWAERSELTAAVSEEDESRLRRSGVGVLDSARGLGLFDRARTLPDPLAVAVPLDPAALRSLAGSQMLPPLFGSLVRSGRRRSRTAGGALARRVLAVAAEERPALVLEVVREQAASVLGHSSLAAIDPAANFKDLGFDSLGAIELRNRLAEATGVQLEATLVFDHPTPQAIARHLLELVEGAARSGGSSLRASQRSEEPIAIVGAACRFPGDVASPDDLWRLLAGGGDGIDEFPADRGWDVERIFDADADRPGKTYVRHGGFLTDAEDFDAGFFAIAPREALTMDPQHRLLLEGAWEALEDAGIDPTSLRGSDTGVYAGIAFQDYVTPVGRSSEVEGHFGTGLLSSVASGRISYTLGLEGPAVTVDTACSASLVAMHLAAQALRSGECGLALAGGSTVLTTPGAFVGMSRQRALAPDGRCKSFAGGADGTGFSEGMGLLLLERLSDARRNDRRILAVIKGSATNQDGASNGLTAPHGPSQERVIRQALANAGLKPSEVDAVEAHGTGTTLGDPIEAQALLATYGQERDGAPLALGSLKSNIGHTQAAAGVGGVIKMVMALREEALPKTLHVDEPTPHVDWDAGDVELLTEQLEWKRGERPRRAGISSFGISGTNAHLILEEAPKPEATAEGTERAERPPAIPWAISAKTPEALAEYAGRLAAHLEQSEFDPIDVAHTLLRSRASLPHRAVVVGRDEEELCAGLAALAKGKGRPGLARAKANHGKSAFLFSGQGSQRARMGAELYEAFPVYREAFDRACEALEGELGKDVKDAVFAAEGTELSESLSRTDLTQASLFALEVALYELATSLGAKPDYLIGHSIGELAAAHVAGVLSLDDAAKLVAARGALMAALPEGGAMASIRASEQVVEESLEPYAGKLTIAGVNAPASISVSGEEEALAEWEKEQEEAGRKTKRLDVSRAFHSHLIDPALDEFERVAASLALREPRIPIVSNLSGEPLTAEQATSPAYWVAHAREAVRFADGVGWLAENGATRFVEIGPQATLAAIAAECLADSKDIALAPSMRRDQDEVVTFVAALGTLQAAGAKTGLATLVESGSHAELPTYPFQRERYWVELGAAGGDPAALGQTTVGHPILVASIGTARDGEHLFTGRLSTATHPWVGDHVIAGTVIVPGVVFCEMSLWAGAQLGAERIEELVMESPLLLQESAAVQIQVSLRPVEGTPGRFTLEIHSRPEPGKEEGEVEAWVRHASGFLVGEKEPLSIDFDPSVWPPEGAEPLDVEAFYDITAEAGFVYGPSFQGMEAAWKLGEDVYAEVALAKEQASEAERFGIHPALFDAALHPIFVGADASQGLRLPFSFSGVTLGAGRGAKRLRLWARSDDRQLSLKAADEQGRPVCGIEKLAVRNVESASLQGGGGPPAEDLFQLDWIDASLPDTGDEEIEIHRVKTGKGGLPASTHDAVAGVLEAILRRLSGEGQGSRLAIVTERAAAVAPGDDPDPAAAAVWGLVRSTQVEHPGRVVIVDTDLSEASEAAITRAIAQSKEPQIALREGAAKAPRLGPAPAAESEEHPPLSLDGTVLITGGLTGLGALAARHLASAHGARYLLLAGRRGPQTPGASELIAELAELGCEASAVACDASDRAQLEQLLAGIPAERPLVAVVHCAGVLDDGTVTALDRGRFDTVLAPKADAAWHLHELTEGMELEAFILYSSAAAIIGSPGQANYAAANSFLEALAGHRRAQGLVATCVAWGIWETGMAADLEDADRARVSRTGVIPIEGERGYEIFDRVLAEGPSSAVAVPIQRSALRQLASAGLLPPMLSKLAPAQRRRSSAAVGALARKVAKTPESEREEVVLNEVREHVADVLGHSSVEAIDPEANFTDLGFDSLGAVELRNRLAEDSDLQLEATLVFDHPTSEAVARYLLTKLDPGAGGDAVDPEEVEIRRRIAAIPVANMKEAGVLEMLLALSGGDASAESDETQAEDKDEFDEMGLDELVRRTLDTTVTEEV